MNILSKLQSVNSYHLLGHCLNSSHLHERTCTTATGYTIIHKIFLSVIVRILYQSVFVVCLFLISQCNYYSKAIKKLNPSPSLGRNFGEGNRNFGKISSI